LEGENRRLQQIVAGLTLDNTALKGYRHRTLVTPTARRAAVGHLRGAYAMSERRACRVLGAHRHTMRYRRRRRADEAGVRDRLRALAAERPRWGSRRLHVMLTRGLGRINRRRVQRLYRWEGLAIRRRTRQRVAGGLRGLQPSTWRRGEAWAMDCMQDVLADGRRFRTRNVLDTVTRECLAPEVDTSLPGPRVVRVLEQLVVRNGAPQQITVDNGPEFAGLALDLWATAHRVTLDFFEPGKPSQNGYLESCTGTFRDECLTAHWFLTLDQARQSILEWQEDDHTQCPHSALHHVPPAVFAQSIPA
jgi:putative transposase